MQSVQRTVEVTCVLQGATNFINSFPPPVRLRCSSRESVGRARQHQGAHRRVAGKRCSSGGNDMRQRHSQRRATNAVLARNTHRQLDLGRLTANHDLPRCIQVRDIHIRISRKLRTAVSSAPIMAAIAPDVASQAASMSWPRFSTSCSPDAKSNVPAAACAVHSPNDKPAAASIAKSPATSRNAARQASP